MTVDIEMVHQQDPRLGRNKVHDSRSRAFALTTFVDRSTWKDKAIRIYDPIPNPNQQVGCCTGVAKCVQLNAVGNRRAGRMLNMATALALYSRSTQVDPWDGEWPPEDTGSSGLASCRAAIEAGLAREYRWLFGGADEVVQNVVEGRAISIGTWWYDAMFSPQPSTNIIRSFGDKVGGHQYVARGYDAYRDLVMIRCWWGAYRDVWIMRSDLDNLLRDGGDAHFQQTI